MFPVASERLLQRIYRDIVMPVKTDNRRAYELGADGAYTRRTPSPGETRRHSQQIVMGFYGVAKLIGVESPKR